ncbi:MAG: exodeoxyribonuclease III [Deltaproteobacteria bacterium]|nr:exodeoxyribonuclease III [Deltaproteobacteria bacterium]
MRIYSWNVNGIRAATKKGFGFWLQACEGDIIGLQEVRALPDQIPAESRNPEGFYAHFSPAKRPGYSGVGLYSRKEPDNVETSLGIKEFDDEGRVQIAQFGDIYVANVYFPNGQGKNGDNSRIPFKINFYQALFEKLEKLKKAKKKVFVIGDYNTAHKEIDLARPKDNATTSGFTPEEREEFDRIISLGWVDTFREFEKGPDHYSWWSMRTRARSRNIGWRIDYVLASKAAMKLVKSAFIHPQTVGSDHCPVGVDITLHPN